MQKKFKFNILTFMLSIAICFAFQPVNSTLATCPDDIVSFWKLDEPTGPPSDNYVDFIRRNDGLGSAGLVAGTGTVGGAQDFNGADTKIEVDADRFFDWAAGDSFTIEAWVKTDGVAPNVYRPIISRVDPATVNDLQWWVGINKDGSGEPIFVLLDNTGAGSVVTPTVAIPINVADGAWHHVVAVRDAGNSANILYVDGVEQGRADSVTYANGFDHPTAKVNIGRLDYSPSDFFFDGLIDEVALYDRALPQSEIAAHRTAGQAGTDVCLGGAPFVPFPDDSLAYWKLDEPTDPPSNKYVDAFDGNDGTGAANIVADTGTVGGAQDFNGTDTKIEVDADRFFDWAAGDSFTIEAWVKTDGVAPNVYRPIISRVDPATVNDLQWWVGINKDGSGEPIFVLLDNTGAGSVVTPTVAIPINVADGAWHHVVAVRDAGNSANILYVDGVEQGRSGGAIAYANGFGHPTAKVNIGRLDYSPSDFFFDGLIDEVALYDRALPQSEIAAHHTEGLKGNGILTLRPEPVADAGPDQTVQEGTNPVTLNGSNSSDADGAIVSHAWVQTAGTAVTLTNATTEIATFTAPAVDSAGALLLFQLTVVDDDGLSASDTVGVTVTDTPVTPPPVADGGGGGGGGCFINTMF